MRQKLKYHFLQEILISGISCILAFFISIVIYYAVSFIFLPKIYLGFHLQVGIYALFACGGLVVVRKFSNCYRCKSFCLAIYFGVSSIFFGLVLMLLLNWCIPSGGLINYSVDGVVLIENGRETSFSRFLEIIGFIQEFIIMMMIGYLYYYINNFLLCSVKICPDRQP
jgi:hypothetical protein